MSTLETVIEKTMYRSRWLLAPIYLGLSLALIALGIKFFQEVFHLLPHVIQMAEADMVLVILSLIDIAMVGGLIVMVMMSGYENFVSELDVAEGEEKLAWLGTMDASSLKMKIAASIVARFTQFYLVASIVWKFGEQAEAVMKKHFAKFTFGFMAVVIIGWLIWKYVFHA